MNYPLVISTPGLSSALSYSLRSVAWQHTMASWLLFPPHPLTWQLDYPAPPSCAPSALNYLFMMLWIFERWQPLTTLSWGGVINQETESNEGEEPLCSENAALGTCSTACPGHRVVPSPVTVGSCGCLVVTEGCLLPRPCQCEGFHRHNFDLNISESSGGGIHQCGASSMRVQPLKLTWETWWALQELTICHK